MVIKFNPALRAKIAPFLGMGSTFEKLEGKTGRNTCALQGENSRRGSQAANTRAAALVRSVPLRRPSLRRQASGGGTAGAGVLLLCVCVRKGVGCPWALMDFGDGLTKPETYNLGLSKGF